MELWEKLEKARRSLDSMLDAQGIDLSEVMASYMTSGDGINVLVRCVKDTVLYRTRRAAARFGAGWVAADYHLSMVYRNEAVRPSERWRIVAVITE